jgi:hypothetical protein
MVIEVKALPFNDIKVSLEQSVLTDEKKTNESEGITPNTGSVTLTVSNPSGVLGFKCAAEVKGTKLKYKLDGTDKAQYTLATTFEVAAVDKPTTKPTAKMALAMAASGSSAASVSVTGTCPGLGSAYITMAPATTTLSILGSADAVDKANTAYTASTTASNYNVQQWCM